MTLPQLEALVDRFVDQAFKEKPGSPGRPHPMYERERSQFDSGSIT
jgi:hypothetical protein